MEPIPPTTTFQPTQQQQQPNQERLSTIHGNDDDAVSRISRPKMMKRASLIKYQSYHVMPEPPKQTLENCTPIVYEILSEGRRSKTSFDTRKSPWAAYLYGCLGDDGLNRILVRDKEEEGGLLYPMTTDNPARAWELLKALPIDAVRVIADDIEQAAISRADSIRRIVMELEETAASSSGK